MSSLASWLYISKRPLASPGTDPSVNPQKVCTLPSHCPHCTQCHILFSQVTPSSTRTVPIWSVTGNVWASSSKFLLRADYPSLSRHNVLYQLIWTKSRKCRRRYASPALMSVQLYSKIVCLLVTAYLSVFFYFTWPPYLKCGTCEETRAIGNVRMARTARASSFSCYVQSIKYNFKYRTYWFKQYIHFRWFHLADTDRGKP